jgi:hypothetical protein
VSPFLTECSSPTVEFVEVEFAVPNASDQWNAGKHAVALVTREQMKHGCLDTVRGQIHEEGGAAAAFASTYPAREQLPERPVAVERHSMIMGDGLTRNSFFT